MRDFLKQVDLFSELPDTDLDALSRCVSEIELAAGEELFHEGEAGDRAFVIKEGEIEVLKASTGGQVLLATLGPSEVIGEMAVLEEVPRNASAVARTDVVLVEIKKDDLTSLLESSPAATRALFRTVLGRWKNTEVLLREREKLAQLGTLTAGVIHELNNPAAALHSDAGHLESSMARMIEALEGLSAESVTAPQADLIWNLYRRTRQPNSAGGEIDLLERSDCEQDLTEWLEGHEVPKPWTLTSPLVAAGLKLDDLKILDGDLTNRQLAHAVTWLSTTCESDQLVAGLGDGSARISSIVIGLKSFANLDQAPVQSVDINESLNQALKALGDKQLAGVVIRKDLAEDLPPIDGYPLELNQAWFHLIDNSVYAVQGDGEISLRTRSDDGWAIIEIEDNGPGISADIQGRVFDPFFTTRPPGHGTGMGLSIVYNTIVYQHRGTIDLDSQPGSTRFTIRLPAKFASPD